MKKNTITIIIVSLVAVLLVGSIVWALVSGKLTLAWDGFGVRFSTAKVVCGSDMIATYNEASEYKYRDGFNFAPGMDVEAMKKIVADIKTHNGYEADPTCQAMIFWTAVETKDELVAKTALSAIKDLHEKHSFPNNSLRTTASLIDYDLALEYLSTTQQDGTSEQDE